MYSEFTAFKHLNGYLLYMCVYTYAYLGQLGQIVSSPIYAVYVPIYYYTYAQVLAERQINSRSPADVFCKVF